MEMAAIMSEQPAFSAELLIDAIKQHPVLFDKSHPRYKEVEFKKELWMNIAADLGVTEQLLTAQHRVPLRGQQRRLRGPVLPFPARATKGAASRVPHATPKPRVRAPAVSDAWLCV
ncbi:hypothetical protein HPB50_004725 [Hyalomma asiaticum]|uniref:Uncharacterized protein n=1 Tax=Hyalomma asiaticum TaxID=266040 RepID=A0ACB7ST71_HYAAI|nr:hypothetical protein HPB50_004725 [Hyalomma asiaticum]